MESDEISPINALKRIGLWLVSLFPAVALFSLYFSRGGPIFPIFRITMMLAFPVWCLYLPVVIAIKDAEGQRIWKILLSGSLIGPVSISIWCLMLGLKGGDLGMIWQGDPLVGIGGLWGMVFSLIVGFLTTLFYVIALRILQRLSIPSDHKSA